MSLRRRASILLMTEGRKSQIILLDERRLDITIQPKLYAGDLLDLVASHFKLKEKQYFGLAFLDETGHYNWLQPEKRVLDHDLPKKPGLLVLYFAIRFYIETIGLLRDISTVELFYLNARQAVFKGQIECDSDTVFELAAYVLQAQNGDYTSDEDTAAELKKLPLIPTYTLKEHPSIAYCEEKVSAHYQRLAGSSRGLAIVNYMTVVERLPTYGIHYYEVKDKKDIPWWLGISPRGIAVYDKNDKTTPRRIFTWKQLENLYYRDKKFSIEVHDPKRVSVSRRTFGPGCVNVHAWFAATSQLTKCIWSMAVAQHQFYLDRKQSKGHLSSARSMSEIAADLSRSTTSLPGSLGSDLSRSTSSQSLPSLSASRFDLNIDSSETQKAQREMYQALKARKEALEDALRRKTDELKRLCFQEGEILGELPPETPLAPGEQPPVFRRRVGTTFSLSVKAVQDNEEDQLSKLELEFDLQSKITSAAQRLAQDKSVPKSVRKQRRQSYNKAIAKLKETEKKLVDLRRQSGLLVIPEGSDPASPTSLHPPPPSYEEPDVVSPAQSPQIHRSRSPHSQGLPGGWEGHAPAMHQLEPPSDRGPQGLPPASFALSPSRSSPQLSSGYAANAAYGTKTQYRNQIHPTLTGRSHSSSSNQSGEYDNMRGGSAPTGSQDSGFSSANNMYNLHSKHAMRYDSADHLPPPDHATHHVEDRLNLPSKHGSLEGAYRRGGMPPGYGSLERKRGNHRGGSEAGFQEPYSPRHPGAQHHQHMGGHPLHPDRHHPGHGGDHGHSHPHGHYDSHSGGHMAPHPGPGRGHPAHQGGHSGLQLHAQGGRPPPGPGHVTPEYGGGGDGGRGGMVEVPVHHDTPARNLYSERPQWDSGSDHQGATRSDSPGADYCYSPRVYEGGGGGRGETLGGGGHQEESQPAPLSSKLVMVNRLQPHTEVSKPYEMADFYKYSERLRRQRLIDQYQKQLIGGGADRLSRASTPSQHSTDSDSTSHSGSGPSLPPPGPLQGYGRRVEYEGVPYTAREVAHSASYHTVKGSQSGVQYAMSYKSQQSVATRHVQYQPLQPMTCQPLKEPRPSTPPSSVPVPGCGDGGRDLGTSMMKMSDSFTLDAGESLADAFSEEMLQWYQDREANATPPTLV